MRFSGLFSRLSLGAGLGGKDVGKDRHDVGYIGVEGRMMDGKNRKNLAIGQEVAIVLKKDQSSGKRTRGRIKEILTKSTTHPHGVKVRLQDGQVGRVQEIIGD